MTRVIREEKERDEAKQEAKAAQLVVASAGDAKAMAEVVGKITQFPIFQIYERSMNK